MMKFGFVVSMSVLTLSGAGADALHAFDSGAVQSIAPIRPCIADSTTSGRGETPGRSAATAATIAQVSWLAGVWVGASGSDERWTPPAGGSMLGVSRTLRGNVMAEFEFLCIVERGGSLVYQAMPNGRSPATDFRLTAIGPDQVTFENPTHDFPKALRYKRRPDGTLEAVVSGDPKQRTLTFTFTKQGT
jgi:hypothetical protein